MREVSAHPQDPASDNRLLDAIVIGGGINGCGIALDAAGRGLKVLLCEQDDLASATSSRSSKLIHGGLRYLEFYQFRMVRKALAEREALLHNAPHIIWPLRFRLPHRPHLRPAWMIRIGLFLYDHLARRESLPGSKGIVALTARAAAQHGAQILTRTACVAAARQHDHWLVTLEDRQTGQRTQHRSRALINASGPWAGSLLASVIETQVRRSVRLVKGSHLVVPRLYPGDEAYILQNVDNRIVFVIPYE